MSETSSPNIKLAVLGVSKRTYGYVFANFWRILIWSLPALVIYFAVTFMIDVAFDDSEGANSWISSLLSVLAGLIIALIWIAIHRSIIHDENYTFKFLNMFLSGYFWKFVAVGAVLMILALAIFSVFAVLFLISSEVLRTASIDFDLTSSVKAAILIYGYFVLAPILFLVVFAYLFLRLSLVFPMQAADWSGWFIESWRRTEGNGWRIVLGAILVNLLPIFLLFLALLAALAFQEKLARAFAGPEGLSAIIGTGSIDTLALVGFAVVLGFSIFVLILSIGLNTAFLSYTFLALNCSEARD